MLLLVQISTIITINADNNYLSTEVSKITSTNNRRQVVFKNSFGVVFSTFQ